MELFSFIDLISKAGFTGLLIILALPKLRRKVFGNGNGNGISEHRIQDLEEHAKIANEEMREIKEQLGRIETDVSFIKGKLDN